MTNKRDLSFKEWTRIRIFKGKKSLLNQAILEALLRAGPLTSWEIAKEIQKAKYSLDQKTSDKKTRAQIRRARTHNVYSAIIRKGGRLEELAEKEYIMHEDKKWTLCFPKGAVILARRPDILPEVNSHYLKKPAIPHTRKRIKIYDLKSDMFGLQIRATIDPQKARAALEKIVERLKVEDMLQTYAEHIVDLAKDGLDIDSVENDKLFKIIFMRESPKIVRGTSKILKLNARERARLKQIQKQGETAR